MRLASTTLQYDWHIWKASDLPARSSLTRVRKMFSIASLALYHQLNVGVAGTPFDPCRKCYIASFALMIREQPTPTAPL